MRYESYFPIYDFKPPELMQAFVRSLGGLERTYVFAVCTYGIAVSGTFRFLGRLLHEAGGRLSGGFAVPMPFNAIGSEAFSDRERSLRMLPTLFTFFAQLLIRGVQSVSLKAEQRCNGCGICERICPVGNVLMREENRVQSEEPQTMPIQPFDSRSHISTADTSYL